MINTIFKKLLDKWKLFSAAIDIIFGFGIVTFYDKIKEYIIKYNIIDNKGLMSFFLVLFTTSILLNIVTIKDLVKTNYCCPTYSKINNVYYDHVDNKLILYAEPNSAFQTNMLTTIYVDKKPKCFSIRRAESDMFIGKIENITSSGQIQIRVLNRIYCSMDDFDKIKNGEMDCHTDLRVRLSVSYDNIRMEKGV